MSNYEMVEIKNIKKTRMKIKGDNFEIKTYIIFLEIPINLITIIFFFPPQSLFITDRFSINHFYYISQLYVKYCANMSV